MTDNPLPLQIRDAVYARPDLCVLNATPRSYLVRTAPAQLEAAEAVAGGALPPELVSFYQGAAEGFSLIWEHNPATPDPDDAREGMPWDVLADGDAWLGWGVERDYSKSGGVIGVPPIEVVFQKGYWINRIVPAVEGGEVTLDGQTYPDAVVYENLYPFDFWSTFRMCALWRRPDGEWRVVLGDDHGACWDDYLTLGVGEYFASLRETLGAVRTFRQKSGEKAPRELHALPAE